jgi:anaerobic sulfite reductase subunit B
MHQPPWRDNGEVKIVNANPYMPVKALVLEIDRQNENVSTFKIAASGLKPVPGQFIEVSIPKVGECPVSISDFDSEQIELTIREAGKVTSAINALKKGDYLFARGPYGNGFPLDRFKNKRLVMVLGGIGLVPVKSIINRYYKNDSEIKGLDLLTGFRNPREIIFKDELNRWQEKFKVLITVDEGSEDWQGRTGLVSELVKEINIEKQDVAIVVGPVPMIKAVVGELIRQGMDKENIWVSYERRMSCGIGKCGHCRVNDQYVCLDGPVFNYQRAETLVD